MKVPVLSPRETKSMKMRDNVVQPKQRQNQMRPNISTVAQRQASTLDIFVTARMMHTSNSANP